MIIPPTAPRAVNQQIEKIEQALDNVVEHGDDDALFISSYLQGHFAVVARQIEMDESATLQALDSAMKESLNDAFKKGELEISDQQSVTTLWTELFNA